MATYPNDLRYTKTHEWVRPRETLVTLGLTDVGAERLGAIGFVELPYPGELFRTGAVFGRVSSDTGSAALRMPFVGQIMAVNRSLAESPGVVNGDPYGEGWIVRIELGDPAEVDGLMDAAEYEAFLATDEA